MNSNQTAMLRRLLESEEAAVQDLAQKIIHTRLLEPDGKAALAEFDKLLQSSVATIRKDAEHADQIGDNEHLEHFFDTQP